MYKRQAQADAICKSGDKDIDAQAEEFFPQGGSPGAAEEEAFVTEAVIPGIQEQIDALRALTPPEGDEDEIGEFLDTAQEALDQIEEDPSTLTGGGSGPNPFAETQQLAADYGLEECAQG